jgi:hypothetical protein
MKQTTAIKEGESKTYAINTLPAEQGVYFANAPIPPRTAEEYEALLREMKEAGLSVPPENAESGVTITGGYLIEPKPDPKQSE